ncbi:DMT family transporter [Halococcus dombrowskii]|uniref:DMT family transporter n=1 Tax=Halococcus dombrowskii TaxID=179637 RepID=A0AAV3SIB2_HALDO|nr:DMT family transporter [Halococcus dombrowskii]UOO96445.1 DMT family transporter [Halococcus dombrowskii]
MSNVFGRIERATPPLAALAIAVVAVSTSAILVRFSAAPSIVKAFYRVLFTTLLLAPFAVVRHRNAFSRLTARDWLVAGAGGVALAIHFASWFESLEFTSVAASVTIVQSQVLFVAIGASWLLAEHVTRRTIAGMALALVGIATLSIGDSITGAVAGPAPLYGNALALVGAVCAAGYVLAGRSLRQRIPLIPYVIVVYSVCAVVLFALVLADGAALTDYPAGEWLLFVGMAIGPGIFGHTVLNWALAHLESSVVSVSLLGEPIGSALLALLLLGEVPSIVTVVGGAVILLGITVTARA